MTTPITQKFYNIFWQNISCRNLFLLSKEELLESTSLGTGKNLYTYTTDRIIISNAQINDTTIDTIKFRTESYDIDLNNSIEERITYIQPIVEEFFNQRFKKSFEKFAEDIENKGWELALQAISILSNKETREKEILSLLREYGFVGNQIESFQSLENHLTKMIIPKKNNELVNEQTINTFFEGIKFIKEIYVNQAYKKLYTTNQVLVNTLNSEDNFESRIKLFHLLYESKIIGHSTEDAFIECSNCEPSTYKGTFQLKMNPSKLKDLKCPLCSKELTYFVPYKLHSDIYKIVKDHDGLLLNALKNKLDTHGYNYNLNKIFLEDIEMDCVFNASNVTYYVEVKMYKLNTSKQKLKNKVKRHYGKLVEDVSRITEGHLIKSTIAPLLLTNINDDHILKEINEELLATRKTVTELNTKILNLELLRFNNS